jgi:hypothetical protein
MSHQVLVAGLDYGFSAFTIAAASRPLLRHYWVHSLVLFAAPFSYFAYRLN